MQISLRKIFKSYGKKEVFNNFDLNIKENDFISLVGDSGKGKSTLLNIIGLLEQVDSGDIEIDKVNTKDKNFSKLNYLRSKIGYLFQNYALVDNLTVSQNLDIALKYSDLTAKEREFAKKDVLSKVGLNDTYLSKIYTLSGGEQQRIAMARLLIKPCELILADEPTGALDGTNKKIIIELLKSLRTINKSLILVTHDIEVSKICDKVIKL